jgi:MFS family permease
VPVGLVLIPLAFRRLEESTGPSRSLDLRGLVLGSTGLLAVTYALVKGNVLGWGSAEIVALFAGGLALLAGFVAWERRAPEPMLPMSFFRSRGFAATNAVSLAMTFGIFGSIFLLAQYFQTVQGHGPLEAGLRTLPWTGMPMLVAPFAGILSDRIGSRPLMAAGLALQAIAIGWLARCSASPRAYAELVVPFVLGGHGHGARLRAGGQRRPALGPPRAGGQGVGRDEHDPRARRRDGHRGARRGVQRERRLWVAADLRGRPAARHAGRRGGALRGRARGARRAGIRRPAAVPAEVGTAPAAA